jgi:hypothetical protein
VPTDFPIDSIRSCEIPGFPGYRISSDGSCWSRRTPSGTLGENWKRLKPVHNHGYIMFCFSIDNQQNWRYAHRLVAEAFLGPCPDGQEVRHKDGDRSNNHLSNLCYGTPKDNAEDRDVHGTTYRGERLWSNKLSIFDVLQIRRSYADGVSPTLLARRYSLNRGTVHRIVKRLIWKHI